MTTDKPINLAEMERVAIAATPGPWRFIPDAAEMEIYGDEFESNGTTCATVVATIEHNDTSDVISAANGSHIAAASPDVVLRLVAALRACNDRRLDDTRDWLELLAEHGIIDEATP